MESFEVHSDTEVILIPELHGSTKTNRILRTLNLGNKDLLLLEGFAVRDLGEDIFLDTDYSEFCGQTNISGWDSIFLCEKVKRLSEILNLGNDDDFDKLMQVAIDDRNKVLVRSVALANKRGYERIVVVTGYAHYNQELYNALISRGFNKLVVQE